MFIFINVNKCKLILQKCFKKIRSWYNKYISNTKGDNNMITKHFKKLQINGLYNGMQPIEPTHEVIKKELSGNDYLKLYGALTILSQNNLEYLEDYYGLSLNDVIEAACIQDNELYLGSFEGYEINERYNLRTLYLTENDNVIMSVYDNKKDRFLDFIA